MNTLDQLVRIAKAFAAHTDTPLKTLSWRIYDDGKVLDGVCDGGRTITTERFDKGMSWFAENAPADFEWPNDIPRPVIAATEEAGTRSITPIASVSGST